MTTAQLIHAPRSIPGGNQYQQLGYVEAHDAVNSEAFAFVAYQETDSSGKWRVLIDGNQSSGAFFEPEAIAGKARTAGAHGKPWFQWGYSIDPCESDPRTVQFRVHVKDGKPQALEMFMQLRNGDGTLDSPRSVRFDWPKDRKRPALTSSLSLMPAAGMFLALVWQIIRP
jgi:hypothetical protein